MDKPYYAALCMAITGLPSELMTLGNGRCGFTSSSMNHMTVTQLRKSLGRIFYVLRFTPYQI
jgi:hypothetical protein